MLRAGQVDVRSIWSGTGRVGSGADDRATTLPVSVLGQPWSSSENRTLTAGWLGNLCHFLPERLLLFFLVMKSLPLCLEHGIHWVRVSGDHVLARLYCQAQDRKWTHKADSEAGKMFNLFNWAQSVKTLAKVTNFTRTLEHSHRGNDDLPQKGSLKYSRKGKTVRHIRVGQVITSRKLDRMWHLKWDEANVTKIKQETQGNNINNTYHNSGDLTGRDPWHTCQVDHCNKEVLQITACCALSELPLRGTHRLNLQWRKEWWGKGETNQWGVVTQSGNTWVVS